MTIASPDLRNQAVDPVTPLATLAELAEHWPELRPLVAENPSAYEGLLQWLGSLDDPQVDAALRRRFGVPAVANVAAPEPVPFVTPDAATSGRWYEPSRAHTSPTGYAPRYAVGLVVLGLSALVTLWFVGAATYDSPRALIAAIASLLAAGGFLVMPGTAAHRVIAATLAAAGVMIFLSFGLWETPFEWMNAIFWNGIPGLGQYIFIVAVITAWLVVRERPGISYVLLVAPVISLLAYEVLFGSFLFLVHLVAYLPAELLSLEGGPLYSLVVAIGWLLLIGVPVLVARLIAPARARAAQRRRQFGAAQPLATHTAGTSGTWQVSPPVPHTNTLAILALVFGILGGVLGIVFGHIARGQIRRTGEGGWGMATAGLVLGYISTALAIVFWIVYIAFFANLYSSIGMF